MLDPDLFSLLSSMRSHFNLFAEADVFFLIIQDALYLPLALAEIPDEQMRVMVGQTSCEKSQSELGLFELQICYSYSFFC